MVALARQILEAAERGAELNQKLLAFGRRQSLKPEPLKLEPRSSTGMVPLLQRTLGEHIELRTEPEAETLRALTDRTLLESAILNLAVNARDAMPKGGPSRSRPGSGRRATGRAALPVGQPVGFVTVADTGAGMAPEVLERVFEPFFTTKEVGKGSGLGLPMVFGFAEQSGGHVAIESQPGEGTAVTILLPRHRRRGAGAPAAAGCPRRSGVRQGQERSLVVEDEPQRAPVRGKPALGLGYEVTAVSAARTRSTSWRRGGASTCCSPTWFCRRA